jgi:hypothetical protein
MSKEKRLQRKLDRMGKKSGNTADVSDGRQEVNEFIEDNGTVGQKRRAQRLNDKVNPSSYQAVGNLTSKQARDIDEDFPSPMNRRLTDKDVKRKLDKFDKKLSKVNSSNSESKNNRKLNSANKALDQVSANSARKIKEKNARENPKPKVYGDNIFTTPVTKSPLNMLGMGVSRCWSGYKPNPDGRPASEKGSCVEK